MKVMFRAVAFVAIVGLLLGGDFARSQEAPKEGAKKRPDGQRPGQRGTFTPPSNPFFDALDANKDGEISADELNNAVAALKKLDKDSDGKLTREETRPAGFGRGTFGGGTFGGGSGAFGGGNSAAFVERIMGNDKNKDGKVTKDELPENAQGMLDRLDENKDGALDKAELEKAGQGFGRRPGGGRPGQPGGAPGTSTRPKRPVDSEPSEKPAEKK
jgi:hypothetical protein